jgi:hypothetical protein
MAEHIVQTTRVQNARGRIVAVDSAYHIVPENRAVDVLVNASYCGILPARFIAAHHPRGAIGVDCGVGPAGAGIAGLWYLEALNIPAAVADVMTVRLGDGNDLFDRGMISFTNRPAADCGVAAGMRVADAAQRMLNEDPGAPAAEEVTNRTVMERLPSGRAIICTDSIAFGLPEDVDNVLLTAGHTGRSAVSYLRRVRPFGFICSDGGGGREESGTEGMRIVAAEGLAGATVDARSAKMGDGLSTYRDGIISAANDLALAAGVRVGMPASEAARALALRSG